MVDQAHFPRPDTLERRISIDLDWYPEVVSRQLSLSRRAGRGVPVPLGLLQKAPLSGFSLEDENGHPLPLLTTEQNRRMTTDVVAHAVIRRAFRMPEYIVESYTVRTLLDTIVGPSRPDQRQRREAFLDRYAGLADSDQSMNEDELLAELMQVFHQEGGDSDKLSQDQIASQENILRQLARTVVMLRIQALGSQHDSETQARAADRLKFAHWWLTRVNKGYVLYVDLYSRARSVRETYGRRIIKFRYEMESDPQPLDRSRREVTYVRGFRTTYELDSTQGIAARSVHTELVPPNEIVVDPGRTYALHDTERSRPARGGHIGRAHLHLGRNQGTAQQYHLFPVIERGTTRLASRSAWSSAGLLLVLTSLSASLGWGALDQDSPQIAAVSIFLLLPGFLSGYAAARREEHLLNDTLIRLPRRVLIGIAFVWAASAAPIAFGAHLPLPSVSKGPIATWEWWAITAAVGAGLAVHLELRIGLIRWWGSSAFRSVGLLGGVWLKAIKALDGITVGVNRHVFREKGTRPTAPIRLQWISTATAVMIAVLTWRLVVWGGSLLWGQ